jgi:hypothetical protein
MSNFSQQPDCLTTLSEPDLTLDSTLDTITISDTGLYYNSAHTSSVCTTSSAGTITLTGVYSIGTDTISFPDLSTVTFPVEWENKFPDFDRVQDMRKEYPGLDIALKKFQEVYKMVEDDYLAQKGQKYNP